MPAEELLIDGDSHKIDVKPATLIFNAHCNVVYPERTMIDPVMTLQYFEQMTELDPITANLFRVVVADLEPVTLTTLHVAHVGFRHLAALIQLSLTLMVQNVKFGWKYPETYLHPKYQGNLADLLLLFNDLPALKRRLDAANLLRRN